MRETLSDAIAVAVDVSLPGRGPRVDSLSRWPHDQSADDRIYNSAGRPVEESTAVGTEADAILRAAGLEPAWLHCPVIDARSARVHCDVEVGPGELVVRQDRQSPGHCEWCPARRSVR